MHSCTGCLSSPQPAFNSILHQQVPSHLQREAFCFLGRGQPVLGAPRHSCCVHLPLTEIASYRASTEFLQGMCVTRRVVLGSLTWWLVRSQRCRCFRCSVSNMIPLSETDIRVLSHAAYLCLSLLISVFVSRRTSFHVVQGQLWCARRRLGQKECSSASFATEHSLACPIVLGICPPCTVRKTA